MGEGGNLLVRWCGGAAHKVIRIGLRGCTLLQIELCAAAGVDSKASWGRIWPVTNIDDFGQVTCGVGPGPFLKWHPVSAVIASS